MDHYLYRLLNEKSRAIIYCIFFLACISSECFAQEQGFPFIRNYHPREYQASSANYAVVQDARGVMYFGNYRGVLEYDGSDWRLIPVSNHSMVRSLGVDSSGTIFVGALGEFGYLTPDSTGNLEYISLLNHLSENTVGFTDVVKVIALDHGAVFQTLENGKLHFWDGDSLTVYNSSKTNPIQGLFYLHEQLIGISAKQGLTIWNENRFVPIIGGDVLVDKNIVDIVAFGQNKLLAKSFNQGFFIIDLSQPELVVEEFVTEVDKEIDSNMFSRIISLSGNLFLIGTVKNGCYLIDKSGKLLKRINENSGLQDNLILGGVQDNGQSLWLALSKGISRIEIASPISYWNDAAGLRGIVYSTIRYKETLYASTPLGVFYLNKDGHFYPVKGIGVESWKLFHFKNDLPNGKKEEQLLVATVRGLFEIRNQKAKLINRNFQLVNIYQSPYQSHRIYNISGSQGVQVIDYKNGEWLPVKEIESLEGRYKSVAEDKEGNLWLVEIFGEGELIKIEFSDKENLTVSNITRFGQKFDLPAILSIYHFEDELLFASTSGLLRFDNQENHFYTDTLLRISPANGAITKLVKDQNDNIWIERQKNTRRWLEMMVKDDEGNFNRDTTMLKGLANTEVWGNIYPEESGLTWIGTTEGLFVYDTNIKRDVDEMALPLIREVILAEDSTLFYGGFPSFPALDSIIEKSPIRSFWKKIPNINYKLNSLTFHYSAPYFEEEYGTEYSHFLIGWDENWSHWNRERKKDYTSLPPGNYKFQVRAKNIYGQISQTAVYPFNISPPWYRTYWAFIGYGFLVVFLIYGTVKLNTQRLHLQNEHLERIVYERTAEIWEQHKEIVKKTVALKRRGEEIATQHDLLEEKNEALENTLQQLKDAQSQLVESEKMASLGQLTAGIAHEINNPINYVKGNINPLKRDFAELKPLFEMLRSLNPDGDISGAVTKLKAYYEEIDADFLLDEMSLLLNGIEEGAIRTKEIVDGLKIFSRSDVDSFKHIGIHSGLEATLTLLDNKIKDKIEIEKNFGELPVVECLPGKLNQVFMNVLTNGIQAIEERSAKLGKEFNGKIIISSKEADCDLPGKGKCVAISIKDNGCGINEEVKTRIFDPFFTTKEIGEGTGLGLSISFGIIERHKGNIKVESELGEGTEFIITLPFKQS